MKQCSSRLFSFSFSVVGVVEATVMFWLLSINLYSITNGQTDPQANRHRKAAPFLIEKKTKSRRAGKFISFPAEFMSKRKSSGIA